MSYLGQVELKSSEIRRIDVTGSTSATHTLTWVPPSEQSLIITINGIKQQNNYTISGTTLTLDTALVSSDELEIVGILDIGTTNVPADDTITNAMVKSDAAIALSKLATDPSNATNLASGTVPTARLGSGSASSSTFLRGDQTYAAVDTSGIVANQDDIALLGFKVAANGSLARYNLVDQSIDAFEDASGVDASASTNEFRNDAGNYYSGSNASTDNASNHTTVGSDTWTSPSDLSGTIKVLVVAGGGGAGKTGWTPGAGGAGGLVYVSNYAAAASTAYAITVGAGGAEQTTGEKVGENGADSVFDTAGAHQILTASGGGGGGGSNAPLPEAAASPGGSGGGGKADNGAHTGGGASDQVVTFGSYSNVGFGFAGGDGYSSHNSSGGGGGAGSVGEDNQGTTRSGNGGSGKDYSAIFGTGVGDSGWFAGGGGGGANNVTGTGGQGFGNGGTGLLGGGGDGQDGTGSLGSGEAGAANTGGGGGGGNHDQTGAAGGSGAVHILYDTLSYSDMTLISNAQTAESAPTTGDLVITYTDGAGTATVNTDIKAYISRDGSAYTSAVTLVSQGTTGGHTILTANGVDLSGITSGTSMRWKIETLNQSAAKDTRVMAVSLGWS